MKTRTTPLSLLHQREIVQQAVPRRVATLKQFLGNRQPSYELTAAAALFSRAIAGFLGIGLKKGELASAKDHFEQRKGASWEVKITDITGGEFVNIDLLPPQTKRALQEGLVEVNTAFAHITFWADPRNQTSAGSPAHGYAEKQQERLRTLARTVIDLFCAATKDIDV